LPQRIAGVVSGEGYIHLFFGGLGGIPAGELPLDAEGDKHILLETRRS
jgi:hypothetical protein